LANLFCGPGFIAFYLLSSLALLLTWTIHRQLPRSDTITPLFLLCQLVPCLASLHQIYLVYYYPLKRINMWNWDIKMMYSWNYAIQNNHTLLRFSLLLSLLTINPIASFRKQRKRILINAQFLSLLLLGYTVSEVFRIIKGDSLVFLPIGSGFWAEKWRFKFFYTALGSCLGFSMRHIIILMPRSLWRFRHGQRLGYLDEEDWSTTTGWRQRWASVLKRFLWLDLHFAFFANTLICPCLAIWLLGRRLTIDFELILEQNKMNTANENVNKQWSVVQTALYVLFPTTDASIWEWKQLIGLVGGMGILAYTVIDSRRSRSMKSTSKGPNDMEKGHIEKEALL